jgi:hypothetical protein
MDIAGLNKKHRRKWLWAGGAMLLLLPLAILYVLAATSPDENIVLSRNEVVHQPSGERLWRGTYWNHSDSLYTDLDVVILFIDKDGKPVGQARGEAARLDPGEVFHLEARLPREALQIRMYQLRWTSYGNSAVLGPFQPWPFGYVQEAECSAMGLRIGACTPAREAD